MASPQRKPRTTKAKTLNLRVTSEQKSAFEQVAMIKQTKVSNFILSNAYEAAQDVICLLVLGVNIQIIKTIIS